MTERKTNKKAVAQPGMQAIVPGRVARGRPPLAEAELYRRRILDATTAVFLEKGFARASTNEIARRAQTSKQTLYSLFPSKAELFIGVMNTRIEQLLERHTYFIQSGEPPRKALTEIGGIALRLFSSEEFLSLCRILAAEVHRFPEPARALWRNSSERGYRSLAEYLRSRGLGGPDYDRSASQFVSLLVGDFFLNAMLHPGLGLSGPEIQMRSTDAVEAFLRLHPEPPG